MPKPPYCVTTSRRSSIPMRACTDMRVCACSAERPRRQQNWFTGMRLISVSFTNDPIPSELKFHPWRVFKSYILIPRGHPLARRGIPTIQDILNEETLLRYPQVVAEIDNREHHRVKEVLERLGLPFNVALEVGNIETVKYYVARGHGIAAVSGMCLSREDESIFHIIEIPEALEGETAYGVILREDKHISPSLRGLLTILEVPNVRSRGQ